MMKTIYIVTLFRGYNYGSALQCFALQQVLHTFGVQPYTLDIDNSGFIWKVNRIINNIKFYASCVKNSERRATFQAVLNNASKADARLTTEVKVRFDSFIAERIRVKRCKYEELLMLTRREECVACISGSDQVWGTSVKYLNPVHFLTFAPKGKRYSYAASIGCNHIPKWFTGDMKKYLSAYKEVSVREYESINTLSDIGITGSRAMIDPTLLLATSDWVCVEKKPNIDTDDFSFMYFLNDPSDIALEHIEKSMKCKQKSVLYYTSNKKCAEINSKYQEVFLSPEEFIWMIHHAKCVYTDSFHGVAFSVIFKKPFYVYKRDYVGVSDQSIRITNILKLFGLEKQYVKDINTECIPDYSLVERVLCEEKEKSMDYLKRLTRTKV